MTTGRIKVGLVFLPSEKKKKSVDLLIAVVSCLVHVDLERARDCFLPRVIRADELFKVAASLNSSRKKKSLKIHTNLINCE